MHLRQNLLQGHPLLAAALAPDYVRVRAQAAVLVVQEVLPEQVMVVIATGALQVVALDALITVVAVLVIVKEVVVTVAILALVLAIPRQETHIVMLLATHYATVDAIHSVLVAVQVAVKAVAEVVPVVPVAVVLIAQANAPVVLAALVAPADATASVNLLASQHVQQHVMVVAPERRTELLN